MNSLGEGSYSQGELPNNVIVGKYSSIGRFCQFHETGNHLCIENKKCVFSNNWDQPTHPNPIIIGNDVWIGEGVRVLENVTIGDGAIIGAGAVISKNVPPYSVVVGNSQRITRFRFTQDQIEKLLNILWWNWDKDVISERKKDMLDIDIFLQKYG